LNQYCNVHLCRESYSRQLHFLIRIVIVTSFLILNIAKCSTRDETQDMLICRPIRTIEPVRGAGMVGYGPMTKWRFSKENRRNSTGTVLQCHFVHCEHHTKSCRTEPISPQGGPCAKLPDVSTHVTLFLVIFKTMGLDIVHAVA
jgi:hypothetical protein